MRRKNKIPEKKQEKVLVKLKPMTDGQKEYIDAIKECDIIACCGLAGTGKSYVAIGTAVELLKDKRNGFDKIVIVRPIIECGNHLGFLPGDVNEKTAPYMQFFKDIFEDFISREDMDQMIEYGIIAVEPLELMRGKTFKRCIVICDEAQNASYSQLKCLLTRFGDSAKIILLGDYTQADVLYNSHGKNTFQYVVDLLEEMDSNKIATVELDEEDIVRHGLIREILKKFP